jgi:hypothetical protein
MDLEVELAESGAIVTGLVSPAQGSVMRRVTALLILLVGLLVASAVSAAGQPRTYVAPLSGAEEVPPNDSRARGQALFRLSPDGTSIDYRLIVANIENVTQAHIHVAEVGANGPVVVWLYPDVPPAQLIPGRFSGILAEGTITEANLVGTLAGQSVSDLIDLMDDHRTYVNVHTSQFPPGEIRGQIR